jgi:membrane dipeptidase
MRRLLLFLLLPLTSYGQSEQKILKKAAKIHEQVFTVDTHADVPMMMVKKGFDIGKEYSWKQDGSQIDIPRMRRGKMDAMFFAVYLAQGRRSPEGLAEAKQKALAIFDTIHSAIKKYPQHLALATTPQDGYRLQKESKIAVYIGIENGWPVGKDLSNLQQFYNLGARYMTLSHAANNDICDSSFDADGPEHQGLSPFGVEVVKEMNRLGMMVDISHVSDSTFYQVIRLTKAPVIASHSSCRAIADVPRNMTDDMIRTLAKNGGVIHINFVPAFVKKPSQEYELAIRPMLLNSRKPELTKEDRKLIQKDINAIKEKYAQDMPNVRDAVDHIDRVVRIAGIRHVGIGMDLDGGGEVMGVQDVSEIGAITEELVRRGYSKKDIRKIWGGNTMRVLKKTEKIASALQKG